MVSSEMGNCLGGYSVHVCPSIVIVKSTETRATEREIDAALYRAVHYGSRPHLTLYNIEWLAPEWV